jgi:hypothetical protein
MRNVILVVALAVALPVAAQEKKPAAAAEAAKPAAAKKTSSAKRQQDARHCLDQASNVAIIKCAEAYL